MRLTRAATAACVVLLATAAAYSQTTIGPGGIPIAPGPSQPGYTPGGIGPGGTPVAPGPAARGLIQETGPGGVPLAPGPAGRIQHQRPVRVAPSTLAGSSTIPGTIMTDENAPPPAVRHPRRAQRAHHHARRRHARD